MDPHCIEILDRTNNDAVVITITDHFHFVLFPTNNRLLDEQLVGGGCIHTTLTDTDEFLFVVGNATATTTQGK